MTVSLRTQHVLLWGVRRNTGHLKAYKDGALRFIRTRRSKLPNSWANGFACIFSSQSNIRFWNWQTRLKTKSIGNTRVSGVIMMYFEPENFMFLFECDDGHRRVHCVLERKSSWTKIMEPIYPSRQERDSCRGRRSPLIWNSISDS